MSKGKAHAQYLHSVLRARERYDINLTPALHRRLVEDIQSNRGEYLGKQSNRLSVWHVAITEQLGANVVYDKFRHQIVTFLPPDITNAKGVPLAGAAPAES